MDQLTFHHKGAPKLIISGAPASGKGTQCEFLKEEYNVVHLSTGDMLRAAVEAGTDLGKEAKGFMDKGALVPDETIIGIVIKRLAEEDCIERGWLLDGFPRTRKQADALAAAGIECDAFIQLDVDDSMLVERVVGRRMDPVTGKIYHLKFSPPPNDPELIARLVHRSDDTEEKVVHRIEAYNKNLASIVEKFQDRMLRVNGNRSPSLIWSEIRSRIPRMTKYEVVFILGGPGSGKGTLCEKLSKAAGYVHLSAGDLLRDELKTGSPFAEMIRTVNMQGGLVPADLVVSLLSKAMYESFHGPSKNKKFLIDGFPRNLDNLQAWYRRMANDCIVDFEMFLDCSEDIMKERILNRAKTSGRADDNEETLMKRFRTYQLETKPVVESYDRVGKLRIVDASLPPEGVLAQAMQYMDSIRLIAPFQRTFAFIKPDAVAAGYIADIQAAITNSNLSIIASKLVQLDMHAIEEFYAEHKGKSFFPGLCEFMTSGPAVAMVLEGNDAIRAWRALMGPTNSFVAKEKAPSSLRGRFGTDGTRNATHGSDSEFSAIREIDFFMTPNGPGARVTLAADNDEYLKNGFSFGGMPLQETYAMIKPITAQMHYDEIMKIIVGHGFEVVSEIKLKLTKSLAERFYAEHRGKGFFEELTSYMSSRGVIGLRLRRTGAIAAWRYLIGPTNATKARMERPCDSIRAKYGIDGTRNAVHGSDSPTSASREIQFFFSVGQPLSMTSEKLSAPETLPAVHAPTSPSKHSPGKKKKALNVPSLCRSEVTLMEAYSAHEVDPIMTPLFRKLMITRPKNVIEFAIHELQNSLLKGDPVCHDDQSALNHDGNGWDDLSISTDVAVGQSELDQDL